MTPQLQQAIKLLQLSNIELNAYVEGEVEQNPLLERDESSPDAPEPVAAEAPAADSAAPDEASHEETVATWNEIAGSEGDGTADYAGDPAAWQTRGARPDGDDLPGIDQTLARAVTLREHLLAQLVEEIKDPVDRVIGAHLVDQIDESGYLTVTLDSVAETMGCDVAKVENVLHQLQQTSSCDCMIKIVSDFLQEKFENTCRPEEPIDNIAIQMFDPLNNSSLEEWSTMACLSLRQFERNFITRVGISPKLFVRIVRFEHVMKIKNDFPGKSWSKIALECGYTDSSHLLREFKEFAEFPPSRFYLQPTSGYGEFPTG